MSCLVQFFKEQSKALRTALFVVAFLSGVAFGQIESGQLTGKVYDPNGARVSGAIVQAKSEETGLERLATTTDEGFFIFTNLPPGIYEVGIQAQGFAVRTQRVRVFVGSVVRLDTQLSVTPVQVDEYVVDASGGVEINTQTGQLSDPISGRQLRELPVVTRDPYSLVTLSSNVTPFTINPLGGSNFSILGFTPVFVNTQPNQDFAIDGQPPTFNNVQVDGGEQVVNYWTTLGQRLPLDGVQEINVITNGFRPEFGRLGGGLINVAIRPGGNDWRGSVFEFNRGFNGNSFENNALGISRGHLVGNNFGFAVGGPIIDDKLYFFNSTEGIITRSHENRVALVPTTTLLATSTAVSGNTNTATFLGAFPLGPVTTGRTFTFADTVAQLGGAGVFRPGSPFLALATTPATAGLPAFQQAFFDTSADIGGGLPQDTGLTTTRLDWSKSDRSLIYGRYSFIDRDIFRGSLSTSPFAGFNTGVRDRDHSALINWLYTLSGPDCCSGPGASPWLMNLKASYSRINLTRNNDFNTIGPRLVPTGFDFSTVGGFPLAFPGDLPFTPNLNSLLTGPLNLFQASADFAGAWHGHQVQFGGSYYHFQDNRNIFSFQNGQFTLGPNVPTALDNLLLGTASSFAVAVNPTVGPAPGVITTPPVSPNFNRSISSNDFSLYGSINWRITPNFNLLLGLRYDFFGRPRSRNDQAFFNFFPGTTFGAPVGAFAFPGQIATGTFGPGVFNVDGRFDGRFFHNDNNNIAPRIGFAWDITGHGRGCCSGGGISRSLTLRGSYGITYERLFYAVSPFFQDTFDFAIPTLVAGVPVNATGLTPTIPLVNPGATVPSNFGPLGVPGTTALPNDLARAISRNLVAPKIHFWSVALDREIFHNTIASLQYAGSAGRDLFTLSDINRPGSELAFLGVGGPTDRLNPLLGAIPFLNSNGKSNYNAFIADVSNSTWRTIGLQFTARYRFAKALDDVSSFFGNNFGVFGGSFTPNALSPFDPRFDYGPSDFDVRHRFIGSVIWEAPYHWFDGGCCGGGGGWKKWVLGGWQFTGLFQAMTGFPFTAFDCSAALTPETPCPRALNAPGVNLGDVRNGFGSSFPDPTVPNRFNFIPAGNFAVSTTPTTVFPPFPTNTVGRNFFRGPGFWDIDFGVYKRFRFTEETGLQLRGEFYNVFNHSNLFVPGAVDISSTNFVPAFKRGIRIIQVGAKFTF
ncbi:MAG TPA: TonB-dependent receptor [Blastocatellia bacterium]